MSVIIAHPGRQHTHQTAAALYSAKLLSGYWSSIPATRRHIALVEKLVPSARGRLEPAPVDERLVKWYAPGMLLWKASQGRLAPARAQFFEHAAYRLYDRWAARQLARAGARAVIGYENSCLLAFGTARQLGMRTILDAASLHHRAQDALHGYIGSKAAHERTSARKDAEIAAADALFTVSDFAAQTYVENGVPREKVFVLPMGADLELFTPSGQRSTDRFVFLFAGAVTYRKAADVLVQAFAKVAAVNPQIELRIAGSAGDAYSVVAEAAASLPIVHLGQLGQRELAREYRRADCFVLPSRQDSFGMVVAEALACGTPVIISDKVGSRDLVAPGENGWIVPMGDVDALARTMSYCASNRDALEGMRAAARESAKKATWEAYHSRVVNAVRSVLGREVSDTSRVASA